MAKIRKHKPIRKKEDKFIRIGSKTYQVIDEKSPTEMKVKLIHIDSKFSKVEPGQQPFMIDLSKLKFEEVKNPIQE